MGCLTKTGALHECGGIFNSPFSRKSTSNSQKYPFCEPARWLARTTPDPATQSGLLLLKLSRSHKIMQMQCSTAMTMRVADKRKLSRTVLEPQQPSKPQPQNCRPMKMLIQGHVPQKSSHPHRNNYKRKIRTGDLGCSSVGLLQCSYMENERQSPGFVCIIVMWPLDVDCACPNTFITKADVKEK